uniref:Uncharacterized protein n=1 Tax=Rhizophora mucronata TaxID=61149 RepID=A0A2P2MZU9_RHIMU
MMRNKQFNLLEIALLF